MTEGSTRRLSAAEVAGRADVDETYVLTLAELGALEGRTDGFVDKDVHLVALFSAWGEAGLTPEVILTAVEDGELTLSFLDTPGWSIPERPRITYREPSASQTIDLPLVVGLHEAIGFQEPDPDQRVREEDLLMVDLAARFLDAGASQSSVRRVFHLYADNLRRLATAEAELYMAELGDRLRDDGSTESAMMELGSQFGFLITPLVHEVLLAIYERHRQHVWTEYSVAQAESALERAGLQQRVAHPPAICFVDLSGYTRLTEEQGDRKAAEVASRLATLVEVISRDHGGRAVRWLGDGGMFYFKDIPGGMLAALEMVDGAAAAGLPPTHIGIHAGPVITQDGDVFGRTVNLASRIASQAQAGEVLTSEETVEMIDDERLHFVPVGSASLKGVAEPVALYRVLGRDSL